MKIFKFIITAIIVFSCFFTISYAEDLNEEIAPIPVNSDTTDLNFEIFSKRAIVYERNSKCILFEKNIDEQCAMASTTKIMTCTLILENCNLQDQVTISQKSASTGGSRLGLSTNDIISVQDLLYGLMLCSGNDAAVALAEHCSGSIENFANLMNSKAQELSLSSTHFVTPHGLDNPEHYTTVRNFAVLTDYALNNPLFLQIVGTKYYDVTINGVPKSLHNTNELLGYLPTVYGVKTGYTSQAGRCLISSAKSNNLDIIVIVLGADTKKIRTTDSIKLINYTFENYETINLADLINQKYTEYLTAVLPYLDVPKLSGTISTELEQNFPTYYPIKKEQLNSVSLSLSYNQLKAPLYQGEQLCSIDFFIENNKIFSTNIYSSAYINKKQPLDYLQFFIYQYKNFYKVH